MIGLWVLFWGIVYEPDQAVWDYLGITGAIYFTGAIVVLVAGMYWKRASSTGAVLALITGLSAIVGLFQKNVALVGLTTLGLGAVAMVVGSLLFPDRPEAGGA